MRPTENLVSLVKSRRGLSLQRSVTTALLSGQRLASVSGPTGRQSCTSHTLSADPLMRLACCASCYRTTMKEGM